jgi:hypothetical protein
VYDAFGASSTNQSNPQMIPSLRALYVPLVSVQYNSKQVGATLSETRLPKNHVRNAILELAKSGNQEQCHPLRKEVL